MLQEQVLTQKRAHLLPKLRCQFAEFLNRGSSTRLRILISPTCVGLRYGQQLLNLEAFLGSTASAIHHPFRRTSSACQISDTTFGFARKSTYILRPAIPSAGSRSPKRPPIAYNCRYRNINRFAIDYPFRTRLRTRLTRR